jgi:hypothetical protein
MLRWSQTGLFPACSVIIWLFMCSYSSYPNMVYFKYVSILVFGPIFWLGTACGYLVLMDRGSASEAWAHALKISHAFCVTTALLMARVAVRDARDGWNPAERHPRIGFAAYCALVTFSATAAFRAQRISAWRGIRLVFGLVGCGGMVTCWALRSASISSGDRVTYPPGEADLVASLVTWCQFLATSIGCTPRVRALVRDSWTVIPLGSGVRHIPSGRGRSTSCSGSSQSHSS